MLWQLIIPGWRLEDVFIHISLWIWRAPKTQYPLHMHSFHDTHIKYVTSRDMIFSHKTAPHFFPFPLNASTQFAVAFSFNKFLIKFVLCFHFFCQETRKIRIYALQFFALCCYTWILHWNSNIFHQHEKKGSKRWLLWSFPISSCEIRANMISIKHNIHLTVCLWQS